MATQRNELDERLHEAATKYVRDHKSPSDCFELNPQREIDFVHIAMKVGATLAIQHAESLRERLRAAERAEEKAARRVKAAA